MIPYWNLLLLALANVTKVDLLYCCLQVNHGHWCLIWPLIFPFSLAHSLLMRQFVITFSKYLGRGDNSASVPHLFFGGDGPPVPLSLRHCLLHLYIVLFMMFYIKNCFYHFIVICWWILFLQVVWYMSCELWRVGLTCDLILCYKYSLVAIETNNGQKLFVCPAVSISYN